MQHYYKNSLSFQKESSHNCNSVFYYFVKKMCIIDMHKKSNRAWSKT